MFFQSSYIRLCLLLFGVLVSRRFDKAKKSSDTQTTTVAALIPKNPICILTRILRVCGFLHIPTHRNVQCLMRSRDKSASLEISAKLSSARNVYTECWEKSDIFIVNCERWNDNLFPPRFYKTWKSRSFVCDCKRCFAVLSAKAFFPLVQCTFERMIRTSGYERHSKAEKNLHSDASLDKLGHLLKTDFSSSGGNTYDLCWRRFSLLPSAAFGRLRSSTGPFSVFCTRIALDVCEPNSNRRFPHLLLCFVNFFSFVFLPFSLFSLLSRRSVATHKS